MRSRAAICVICEPGGRVLLTRRSGTCPKWPGHWDLPGGYVNDGESLLEGLQREIAEETGLFLPAEAMTFEFKYPEEHVDVYVFSTKVAKSFTPCFKDAEHDRFIWARWGSVPQPLLQPLELFPRFPRR